MNPLRVVCAVLAVVMGSGEASIPGPHVALPHSLLRSSIGVQVPVAAVTHHAPAVAVSHHVPAVKVTKHTPAVVHAPAVAVSHQVPAVTVAKHIPAVVHAPAVAVSHHVPTVTVTKHSPAVVHAPAVAVSHQVPAVTVAKHIPAVVHAPAVHSAPVYTPVAAVEPVAPVKSQYHAQDELGRYTFGYNAGTSARDESRDAYGNVRGSFSYVDSYGNVQSHHYVADDDGFRVSGTNLPVHRRKRSYGTYPASTGPLATVAHVAPVLHAAPVVHAAPLVQAAPVVHAVPALYGYGAPRRGFSYGFRTVPAVTSYRNYGHPSLARGSYH